jgi:hypothetical protein
MTSASLRAIGAAAIAWMFASTGVAWAGQDPDPVPPGTLTIGPLRISPSLTLSDMGVDNNVLNEPVAPKSDFTFTISPRADLQLRMRRLLLKYTTATEYVYFHEYSSERGTNTSSSARVDVELGRLAPYATIHGLNSRKRINNEVDERARHRDLGYTAGVSFKFASRTSVVVNGQHQTIEYDPEEEFRGVKLEESFNGRRRGMDVGLSVALTPITSLTVAVAREEQRFALSPERDSNSWRLAPTVIFPAIGVLTGNAAIGYRRFEPLSPTVPGYSGLIATVGIGATIYSRHQMALLFGRDVQYSYDLDSTYYVGTGGSVTWTWLLGGPIDIRGTGERYLMDYRLGRPSDTSLSYGGGIGYRFTNRARLGINVNWQRRESGSSAEREYRNKRIFAGLSWGTTL